MSRPRMSSVARCVSVTGACIFVFVAAAQESTDAQTLDERIAHWAEELRSEDANRRAAARDALAETGGPAVPALLDALKDEPEQTRLAAIAALKVIGPVTDAVVPGLLEALNDECYGVHWEAHRALRGFGPGMLPSLEQTLATTQDLKYQERLVKLIGSFGPDAASSIPLVVGLLTCWDEPIVKASRLKEACAKALGEIGAQDETVVPALIEALLSPHSNAQGAAAWALGQVGAQDETVVPALIEALASPHWNVQRSAAWALGHIGPPAGEAVPALIQVLDQGTTEPRKAALNALCAIGPEVDIVMPRAIPLLDDPSLAQSVAPLIAKYGRDAEAAVPHLVDAMAKSKGDKWPFIDALAKIGPKSVQPLMVLLDDDAPNVQAAAAKALGTVGAEAEPAIPKLAAFLDLPDELRQHAALDGLVGIGEAAFPTLEEALLDSKSLGYATAERLAKAGPPALPLLEQAVSARWLERSARSAAARSMAQIGEAAIPRLMVLLDTTDSVQFQLAASSLGEIGPPASSAIPRLLQGARHYDAVARRFALGAAWRIEPENPQVRQACLDALGDFDHDVRRSAKSRLLEERFASPQEIVEILRTVGGRRRETVEDLLTGLGSDSVEAVMALMASEEKSDRASALRILGGMEDLPPECSELFTTALGGSTQERRAALQVIEGMPPEQWPPVEALMPLLRHHAPDIAARAGALIGRVRPIDSDLVPTLIAALQGTSMTGRRAAAVALRGLGPDGAEAAPVVLSLYQAEEPLSFDPAEIQGRVGFRELLYQALLSIAPGSPEAIAFLTRRLGSSHRSTDPSYSPGPIIYALGKAGPPAADAAPELWRILRYGPFESEVRIAAGKALLAIVGPSQELCDAFGPLAARSNDLRVKEVYEEMRSTVVGYEVVREEILSGREGKRHFQFYLDLDNGQTRIPLARLYTTDPDRDVPHAHGFYPDSLDVQWLEKDVLLQVSWGTCSVGSGHYTAHSLLLLQRLNGAWRELFRHTGEGRSRGGWMCSDSTSMRFKLDREAGGISLRRMDSGYSYTEEPHPLARPREISGKTHYEYDYPETSVWLCEVREDGLEILPGKRWIGLGEHTFPVHELAKRLAPWQQNGLPPDEEIDKKLEELLRLNPALSETDVVTGSVLIADPVPPFKPWGGHMYSTNEK